MISFYDFDYLELQSKAFMFFVLDYGKGGFKGGGDEDFVEVECSQFLHIIKET